MGCLGGGEDDRRRAGERDISRLARHVSNNASLSLLTFSPADALDGIPVLPPSDSCIPMFLGS
eukprot:3264461-Rhodomonas_salina.5